MAPQRANVRVIVPGELHNGCAKNVKEALFFYMSIFGFILSLISYSMGFLAPSISCPRTDT